MNKPPSEVEVDSQIVLKSATEVDPETFFRCIDANRVDLIWYLRFLDLDRPLSDQ